MEPVSIRHKNVTYTPSEVLRLKREKTEIYGQRRLSNGLFLALGDTVALCLALLVAGEVRYLWFGASLIPPWSWYLLPLWWVGAKLYGLLPSWGLGPVESLRRLLLMLVMGFSGLALILFLTQQATEVSRVTLTTAWIMSFLTVPLFRLGAVRLLVRADQWGVPAVIYGAGEAGARVAGILKNEKGLGLNPIALLDDDPERQGQRIEGLPVLASAHRLLVDAPVAVLAMPDFTRDEVQSLLEGPLSSYRSMIVIPELVEIPSLWVRPRDLYGVLGLEIRSNLLSPTAQFLKRASDISIVLLTAPVWAPVCALIALAIWLEDGAGPFYEQERVGKGGQIFNALKFRTMVPNAEEVLKSKLADDENLRKEWEENFKLKNDPRVTRVGHLLRRFSLDELPQLINVLRVEMSLVGPRPLPPYHHEDLPHRVTEIRNRMLPGMTGFWQVSGRSDVGSAGMERWDPYYVRNWSVWLDVVILLRTVRVVLKGSGAY